MFSHTVAAQSFANTALSSRDSQNPVERTATLVLEQTISFHSKIMQKLAM
jgi:hypothetical protein